MTVWWDTWAECSVVVSRLKREGVVDDMAEEAARVVLDRLTVGWIEIEPTYDVRLLASLLSKDHPLKTADAFQFAAALRCCEGETNGKGFACFDRTLRQAAASEGFDVFPEAA